MKKKILILIIVFILIIPIVFSVTFDIFGYNVQQLQNPYTWQQNLVKTENYSGLNITSGYFCDDIACYNLTLINSTAGTGGGSFTNNSDISVNIFNVTSINLSGITINSWDDVNMSSIDTNDTGLYYPNSTVDTLINNNMSLKVSKSGDTMTGNLNLSKNLTIGTYPFISKLYMNSLYDFKIINTISEEDIILQTTGDGEDNDNQLFLEGSNGYVGIGTNTTTEQLTVAGNVNATGIFCSLGYDDDGIGFCSPDWKDAFDYRLENYGQGLTHTVLTQSLELNVNPTYFEYSMIEQLTLTDNVNKWLYNQTYDDDWINTTINTNIENNVTLLQNNIDTETNERIGNDSLKANLADGNIFTGIQQFMSDVYFFNGTHLVGIQSNLVNGSLNVTDLSGTTNIILDGINSKIGIGTSNPIQELDLRGQMYIEHADPENSIFMNNTDTENSMAFRWSNSGADNRWVIVPYLNSSGQWNDEFYYDYDNTEWRFDEDLMIGGSVGIGTDNPTHVLNVIGTINLTGHIITESGMVVNENGIDVDFRVESDNLNDALFVQGSDGNVGIGTLSPGEDLQIYGGIDGATFSVTRYDSGTQEMIFTADSGNNRIEAFGNKDFLIKTSGVTTVGGGDIRFYANDTEALRLLETSGEAYFINNVGIGTGAPDTLLSVGGNSVTTILSSSTNNEGIEVVPGKPRGRVLIEGSTQGELILVDSGGTAGRRSSGLKSADDKTTFVSYNDAGGIVVDNILSMDHGDGKVGIGTDSPAADLDIVGDGRPNLRFTRNDDVGQDNIWQTDITSAWSSAGVPVGSLIFHSASKDSSFAIRGTKGFVARIDTIDGDTWFNGSLGLGIVFPKYKLSVNGSGVNISNTSNDAVICLNDECISSFPTGDGLENNSDAYFSKLGVNTSSLTYALEVNGDIRGKSHFRVENPSFPSTYFMDYESDPGGEGLQLYNSVGGQVLKATGKINLFGDVNATGAFYRPNSTCIWMSCSVTGECICPNGKVQMGINQSTDGGFGYYTSQIRCC